MTKLDKPYPTAIHMANNEATVFIGLGSNLGDRRGHIREALERLEALPDTTILRRSAFYETQPRFVEEQPNFLNAVACLRTTLSPQRLLEAMLSIERAMGRVRDIPKGPRVIDLDILLYDDLVVDTPDLQLPHPGLPHRAFVLVPLAELAPDLLHPTLFQTIATLTNACPDTGWVTLALLATSP